MFTKLSRRPRHQITSPCAYLKRGSFLVTEISVPCHRDKVAGEVPAIDGCRVRGARYMYSNPSLPNWANWANEVAKSRASVTRKAITLLCLSFIQTFFF